MRKLFFYANCHAQGLTVFLRLNPAFNREFTVSYEQNYLVQLGHTQPEQVIAGWKEADAIAYNFLALGNTQHPIHIPTLQNYSKPTAVHIPLSNPQNFGYFCSPLNWSPVLKDEIRARIKQDGLSATAEYYWAKGDLEWVTRYRACLRRMQDSEVSDEVPEATRISDLFETLGHDVRLMLVPNHPSSIAFYYWAKRLSEHLGIEWKYPAEAEMLRLCRDHPNYAGLPCEDFIPPSSRHHLGLKFSDDDGRSRQVVEGAIAGLI